MASPPASGRDRIGLAQELVPDWQALTMKHATTLGSLVGTGVDNPRRAACGAFCKLSLETAYELMDDSAVVDTFQEAYDGGLGDCATIVDTHVRLLADALLVGDAGLTAQCYAKLDSMPPLMRRQVTAATAAVGTAALEAMRDEHEFMRSMLEEDASDTDAYTESLALVTAIDQVLDSLPVPPPEAFEDQEG